MRIKNFVYLAIIAILPIWGCSDEVKEEIIQVNVPVTQYQRYGAVYGKVYNGLTRAMITTTTNTNLKGTLTYVSPNSGATVSANATFDANGYYYFTRIPVGAPFIIEFTEKDANDANVYVPFMHENTGLTDNDAALNTAPANSQNPGTYVFKDTDGPSLVGHIYLFPANVNPGDITVNIVDASNGQTIAQDGTLLLRYTNTTTPLITSQLQSTLHNDPNLANTFVNNAGIRTDKMSVSINQGEAILNATNGATLVLGMTYGVDIYGIAGYNINTSASITISSSDATTVRIAMTETLDYGLIVLARSDYDTTATAAAGQAIPTNGTVAITFNKDIEVDPLTQYNALITRICDPGNFTTCAVAGANLNDLDGDTTQSQLAAFSGSLITPVQSSNHLTVTASENVLTIAVGANYLTTEDTDEDLGITIDLTTILIREANQTHNFVPLDDTSIGTTAPVPALGATADVIIRNSTALQ